MQRSLARMAARPFDLFIIGGGINGSAIARDAALRGFRVALVEKADFGFGTTSRSTRLAHGGLRYLANADLALVREGLSEREILFRTAPHLVRPLGFLTPVYQDDSVSFATLRLGMWLYDRLAWERSVPRHRALSRAETLAEVSELRPDGLRGALMYFDGQIAYPERLCMENLLQASEQGAEIANYAAAEGLLTEGQTVRGVAVRDVLTNEKYEVRASVVVNAAGPWVDRLNGDLLGNHRAHLRLTKGIHLLIPRVSDHAIVMLAKSDGRLFFAVPWEDSTLLGTTDTDFDGDPTDVIAHDDEVRYLLDESRRVFPGLRIETIAYTTAGVRPLAAAGGKAAGTVSRRHRLVDHTAEGAAHILSVVGGKITNQRRVAEDAVDWVAKRLGRKVRCRTRTQAHYGGAVGDLSTIESEAICQGTKYAGIGPADAQRLVRLYGSRFSAILGMAQEDRALQQRIVPDGSLLQAEVAYAVEVEMALTTADVLLRRTGIGLMPGQGRKEAPEVAALLGRWLGRTEDAVAADLESYHTAIARMQGGIPRSAP